MKLFNIKWTWIVLLIAGCSGNDVLEPKDAFYKLYGNGTFQEGIAMSPHPENGHYIIGNQYVRNQDSAAVLLIRVDKLGNQLWSKRYFGKGYNSSKSIIVLPDGEILVLASARESDKAESVPVIYRLNEAGELLNEYFIKEEETSGTSLVNDVPEDMLLGDNGTLFFVGNRRGASGVSRRSYIRKVDIYSGEMLDQREFNNSEETEVKKIFKNGSSLLVVGNTRQEVDDIKNQSLFVASFSTNLIEADHSVIGSANDDTFKRALINSLNEFVIISSEQSTGSTVARGVLRFLDISSLRVSHTAYLDFSANEVPEAIAEDAGGNYFVAVNSFGERGRTNILLNKINHSGISLWESPREIGGEGSDKIAQLRIVNDDVYLLKNLDMQNENTLISLSKIRF